MGDRREPDGVREIAREFADGDEIESIEPLGNGHIHATHRVTAGGRGAPRTFVLQEINTRVFADPETLCENVDRITRHLRARLAAAGRGAGDRSVLRTRSTRAGGLFVRDTRGGAWRAFDYIEGTRTVQRIEGPEQARAAALAFARFAADLVDLPGPPLAETIPDFSNPARRMRDLESAVRSDPLGRARDAGREIESARSAWALIEADLAAAGVDALPPRVMHNDCKLDNLLLDARSGEALCVIDLDTTMPATALADFGQLVRTGASRAAEDETRLETIAFEAPLFSALAEGYVAGARGFLSEAECEALPLAGPVVTLENAVRFLADHLEGDVYFRIHRAGHNLDRARAQLRLLESFSANEAEMRRTLRACRLRTSP